MKKEETTLEILNYVSLIETFYTDKINQIKLKNKQFQDTQKKVRNVSTNEVDKQRELEEILYDSLESTKKSILARKAKAKREASVLKKQGFQTIKNDDSVNEFETSISKLYDYQSDTASRRVRYDEFTKKDKSHFIEIFVSHPNTLKVIHQAIFP